MLWKREAATAPYMKTPTKHSHREIELLDALHRLGGSARSAELARTLDVSEETIRRTIKTLSKSGVLERMYGGAYLAGPRATPGFLNRITKNPVEKRAIATRVIDRVQDGMTLFLDVGSTTAFVAEKLRDLSNLTVATNSVGVAQVLAGHNGNHVHLLGGEMHSGDRGAFGSVTHAQCRLFAYDLAIFSTDALSARQGFLYLSAAEAALAQAVTDCAARVMVVMDHQKFDQTAPHRGFDARVVDEIITGRTPTGDLETAIRQWGIDVYLADGDAANE